MKLERKPVDRWRIWPHSIIIRKDLNRNVVKVNVIQLFVHSRTQLPAKSCEIFDVSSSLL